MGSAAPLASRRQTCSRALYAAEKAFGFQSEGRAARSSRGQAFRPKQHAGIVANSFRQAQRKPTTTTWVKAACPTFESGVWRVPAGKGKKEAVTPARVALRAYSVPAHRTRA